MKQVIVLWENEYRKAQFQRENPGRDLPEEHYIKIQQIKVKICLSPRQPKGFDCGLYYYAIRYEWLWSPSAHYQHGMTTK